MKIQMMLPAVPFDLEGFVVIGMVHFGLLATHSTRFPVEFTALHVSVRVSPAIGFLALGRVQAMSFTPVPHMGGVALPAPTLPDSPPMLSAVYA